MYLSGCSGMPVTVSLCVKEFFRRCAQEIRAFCVVSIENFINLTKQNRDSSSWTPRRWLYEQRSFSDLWTFASSWHLANRLRFLTVGLIPLLRRVLQWDAGYWLLCIHCLINAFFSSWTAILHRNLTRPSRSLMVVAGRRWRKNLKQPFPGINLNRENSTAGLHDVWPNTFRCISSGGYCREEIQGENSIHKVPPSKQRAISPMLKALPR